MLPVHGRRRNPATSPDAEDRYLRPGWRRRLRHVDGLLAVRAELTVAYREGRVTPQDEDAIAARVEWIDARIGHVSRGRALRHREATGRIRAAAVALVMLVVATVILVLAGAPDVVVRVGAAGVAAALLALLVMLAIAPRRLPGDDDPDLTDL